MMWTTRCMLVTASLAFGLGGCGVPVAPRADQSDWDANTPGWTGRTFVAGSTSTIAGSAEATYDAQKWGVGRQR